MFGVGDASCEEPQFEDDEDKESEGLADTHHVFFITGYIREKLIDETSRTIFAVSYGFFNVSYWIAFYLIHRTMHVLD